MTWPWRRRRRVGVTRITANFVIRDRRAEERYAAMLAYYGPHGECEGMGV